VRDIIADLLTLCLRLSLLFVVRTIPVRVLMLAGITDTGMYRDVCLPIEPVYLIHSVFGLKLKKMCSLSAHLYLLQRLLCASEDARAAAEGRAARERG
jgi:hypothetical protein